MGLGDWLSLPAVGSFSIQQVSAEDSSHTWAWGECGSAAGSLVLSVFCAPFPEDVADRTGTGGRKVCVLRPTYLFIFLNVHRCFDCMCVCEGVRSRGTEVTDSLSCHLGIDPGSSPSDLHTLLP